MSKDTRKSIQNAFLHLAKTKPIDKITVREIVDYCGVNRNSFYYHFEDLPDLIESVIRDRLDKICENMHGDASLKQVMTRAAGQMQKDSFIWQNLAASKNRALLDARLIRLAASICDPWLEQVIDRSGISETDYQIIRKTYSAQICGVLLDWVSSGGTYDLEAFAERMLVLRSGSAELMAHNARSAGKQ